MNDFSTDLAELCIRLDLSCKCHTESHDTISNKLLRLEVHPSKRGQITLCFGQVCNKYSYAQALQFILDAFSNAEANHQIEHEYAESRRAADSKAPTELPWHD